MKNVLKNGRRVTIMDGESAKFLIAYANHNNWWDCMHDSIIKNAPITITADGNII